MINYSLKRDKNYNLWYLFLKMPSKESNDHLICWLIKKLIFLIEFPENLCSSYVVYLTKMKYINNSFHLRVLFTFICLEVLKLLKKEILYNSFLMWNQFLVFILLFCSAAAYTVKVTCKPCTCSLGTCKYYDGGPLNNYEMCTQCTAAS
jgi:hypothetical protein